MKIKLHRIAAFATTGVACVFISLGTPVSAQEEVVEETTIEATIPGEAIPEEAKTIKDPKIPLDDLGLLVKPLTVEELQNEAAGWLFLLKQKVKEISDAEVAIKRETRLIKAETEAAKLLEDAQLQLAQAKEAQEKAQPNTPEYEEATKQLEEAKVALREAEASVKEVAAAEAKIKAEEAALQGVVEEAQQEKAITQAKAYLEKAEKIREDLVAGSPRYEQVTEEIDALAESLIALEEAEKELASTIPGSSKNKQAKAIVKQAREAVNKATQQLTESVPEVLDETSGLPGAAVAATASENETSEVENAQEQLNVKDLNQLSSQEVKQQIAQISETLQKKAAAEEELRNQLLVNVTDLQVERSGIIDRFEVVLDALDDKGGDTSSYRKYIDAVSGIDIDVTDTKGLGIRLLSWLRSEEGGIRWGLNLAVVVTIFVVSVVVSRLLAKFANRLLGKVGNTSNLFRDFIVVMIKRGGLVVGALLGLASIGVNLGPILALVGGASFVLAFALQSNLGNFASGLMLLVSKPFDVGDEVKVAGYWAYVDSISLASTKLKDFSGSIITLPNNTVWGGDIINYTHTDIRKIGIAINIRFNQDMDTIYKMWMDITSSNPKVLQDPAPGWFPWNSYYDYYISVSLSAWTKTDDYWEVYVEMIKALQDRLDKLNIELAVPVVEEIGIDKLKMQEMAKQSAKDFDSYQITQKKITAS